MTQRGYKGEFMIYDAMPMLLEGLKKGVVVYVLREL